MEGSITTRVVEAVAAEEGVDPLDLPPLSDVVDTDALDRLFDPARRRAADGDDDGNGTCEVWFSYAGWEVHIRDGDPILRRRDHPADHDRESTDP